MIEHLAERAATAIEAASAAAGALLWSEQAAAIARTIALGLIGWGSLALLDARNELAVLRTQHVDFERRLLAHDQWISNGTDDRWRRRDHDAYAAQVDDRLDGIAVRVDAQGKLIATLVSRLPAAK